MAVHSVSPMANVVKQSKRWAELARAFDLGVSRLLAPRLLQTASRPCHHQQLPLRLQNHDDLAQTRQLLLIVQ
jgi:hypothetical protein